MLLRCCKCYSMNAYEKTLAGNADISFPGVDPDAIYEGLSKSS